MKKFTLVTLILMIALALGVGLASAANSRTVFTASLSEEDSGSDAHGTAVFVMSNDGSKLSYKLVVNGLDNTLMAHIHVADTPGGNGPVVLWLYPSGPPPLLIPGTFNGLLGTGTATSANLTGAMEVSSMEALRTAIEDGRAYVNVHTTAFMGGEIRGPIR